MAPSDRLDYLALAKDIGHTLVRHAHWTGTHCTWRVGAGYNRQVMGTPSGGIEFMDGSLYAGAAGVALFLAELWGLTGDSDVLATAHGAAAFAYSRAVLLPPNSVGFFVGRVGVAYTLARLAALSGSNWCEDSARTVLAPIHPNEESAVHLDVIHGIAGAIPAVLQMAKWINLPYAEDLARRMGDDLLGRARRGVAGWWWNDDNHCAVAGLTGFGHGAAGCGHALLELYALTGEGKYRFGAEQAYSYEESHFEPKAGNWLDLRHKELREVLVAPNGREALHARFRAGGRFQPYVPHCSVAWCHGATGIGLSRFRAFELLHNGKYMEEGLIAAAATAKALLKGNGSSCLCHGDFGFCETLLRAGDVSRDPIWLPIVESRVRELVRESAQRGNLWLSGYFDGEADFSLMMGDAGVGYMLLRLHSATVPSVLAISVGDSPEDKGEYARQFIEQRHHYIESYFGRILRILKKLRVEPLGPAEMSTTSSGAEIAGVYSQIESLIMSASSANHREILDDAFAPERARYKAAVANVDLTDELVASLVRPTLEEICWEGATFSLAANVRLVECQYDWDSWLQSRCESPPSRAPESLWFAVFRQRGDVHYLPVSTFYALLLRAFTGGRSISAAKRELMACVEFDAEEDALSEVFVDRVRSLFMEGVLTVCVDAGDSNKPDSILFSREELGSPS